MDILDFSTESTDTSAFEVLSSGYLRGWGGGVGVNGRGLRERERERDE